jgi:hypothetical protein
MKAEDLLGHLAFCGVKPQVVANVDASDDQHLPVQLDLTIRFRSQESLPGRDPARLQRAPEGSGESPGGGSHDVVQRGRVGLVDCRIHSVMLCDL